MKFTVAWAGVLTENNLLKTIVAVLTIICLVFSVALARLSVREPILIERECTSRYVSPADLKHTNKEIESFIRSGISMRFDSNAADFKELLSDDETAFRIKEQEELKKKSLIQRVLVNSIKQEANDYVVDADRLLSTGKVRSALQFIIRVELASVARTVSNPYGLIIRRVSQVVEQGENK